MTKTLRTLAQAQLSLDFINECIDNTGSFLRDLRYLPESSDICVIGYPKYGLYLNSRSEVAALTSASLFSAFDAARVATVRNGKGEVAQIVTLAHARAMAISQQEDAMTNFWAMHREVVDEVNDLVEEREQAAWGADIAAYHAHLDREAERAAYDHSFDDGGMAEERARHP